jgi:predicted dithiol-disulfide oxidoreductase (DUF899 family)
MNHPRIASEAEWLVAHNYLLTSEKELTRLRDEDPASTMSWEMLSTATLVEKSGKTKLTVQWSALNPTEAERKTL